MGNIRKCTIKDLSNDIKKAYPNWENESYVKEIITQAERGEFHDFKNNADQYQQRKHFRHLLQAAKPFYDKASKRFCYNIHLINVFIGSVSMDGSIKIRLFSVFLVFLVFVVVCWQMEFNIAGLIVFYKYGIIVF